MVKTLFILILLAAAGFIGVTSSGMPDTVASHFDAAGMANGYMPRTAYTAIMLLIGVAVPLVAWLAGSAVYRSQGDNMKLPNRDYWLAPERSEETIDFLVAHTMVFGCLLALFLCYGHWQVVLANRQVPAQLDSGAFMTALGIFMLGVMAWVAALFWKFGRTPY